MGVSSSQPVPEPPQSTAISQASPTAERVPHHRPKMDDLAASQQLLEEEARFTPAKKQLPVRRSKRGSKAPAVKSFSLNDIQAYIDNENDTSAKNGSFPSPHNVEVPDSQVELPETIPNDAPNMSSPIDSSIAVPASAPEKGRGKKGKKINRPVLSSQPLDQNTPSKVGNIGTPTTPQSKRKHKRGKYHTGLALNEAEPETAIATVEEATTAMTQSEDAIVGAEEGAARSMNGSGKKEKDLARKGGTSVSVDDDDIATGESPIYTPSQPALKKIKRVKKSKSGRSKKQPPSASVDTERLLAPASNVDEPSANALPEESSSGEDEIPHVSPPKASSSSSSTKRSKHADRKTTKRSKSQRRYSRKSGIDLSITAADRALNTVRDVHHPPDLRSTGAYTEDEEELIRRAIRDFQERKGLETLELVDIIQWSDVRIPSDITASHPDLDTKDVQAEEESKEFWEELREVTPRRNLAAFKAHVRSQYHAFKSGGWTEEEDEDLKKLVQLHPGRWKLISQIMGNRSLLDVYNRWKDYGQYGESRNTSRWSESEERSLKRALKAIVQRDENYRAEIGKPPVAVYTNAHINWPAVCSEMGNIRSRLQCTVKWSTMKKNDPFLKVQPVYERGRTPDPDEVVEPTPRKAGSRKSSVRPALDEGGVEPTPRKRGRPPKNSVPPTPSRGEHTSASAKKPRQHPKRKLNKNGKLPKIDDHFQTLEEADKIPATPKSDPPGVEQMQWGDKFDLVEEVAQLQPENEESIDWDKVADRFKHVWAPEVLQEAFQELLQFVDEQEPFFDTIIVLLNHIAWEFKDEIRQHYLPPQNVEPENDREPDEPDELTEGNQPNTKRKRKLGRRDSLPKSRSKRMKIGSTVTTPKIFKSKERITASDDSESEFLEGDDNDYDGSE